jgi:hypothetical protein
VWHRADKITVQYSASIYLVERKRLISVHSWVQFPRGGPYLGKQMEDMIGVILVIILLAVAFIIPSE